jgi:hypothetical protein
MKKLLVCFAILALLLVPAMAMAESTGEELPPSAVEVAHWELVEGAWVGSGNDGITGSGLARCWRSTPRDNGIGCNRQTWDVDVKVHASVAQWLKYDFTGTRWDWRILKPGTYAADCITLKVTSNNDVAITFSDFANLEYQAEGGVERKIPISYAWGETLPEPEDTRWVSATDLNEATWRIEDSALLHEGWTTKLWNKITVVNCNSSCEYENTAQMHISVTNMKLWVDPTTGGWK